jgi:predicted alpha/beta-fold hydrolase
MFPDLYDIALVAKVKTIRDFDEHFTALSNGFKDADDYYSQSSSMRVASQIRVPTLIIHALDDPFIPFEPMRAPAFSANPNLLIVATERGGHVAFIAASAKGDVDRFWAENRVVEFCTMAEEMLD